MNQAEDFLNFSGSTFQVHLLADFAKKACPTYAISADTGF